MLRPCLKALASKLSDALGVPQIRAFSLPGRHLYVSTTAEAGLLLNLMPKLGESGRLEPVLTGARGSVWRFLSQNNAVSKSSPSSISKTGGGPTSPRLQRPSFLRPVLFCVTGSTAAFTYAALLEESRYRSEWEKFKSRSVFEKAPRSAGDPSWLADLPAPLQNLYREFWGQVQPKQRIVGAIVAVNMLIFLAMQRTSLQGFMFRNFVHCLPPLPLRSVTLLTSNFAHSNAMHLGFNMIAFWSFGREAAAILGPDQFLGFYLSAGLASALLSHLGRFRSLAGGLSLGASGAVYACFALTAITKPDTQVALIFLPMLPFSISDALSVMILVDLAGVLMGWRRFDHFGHLGGALFGLYYVFRGEKDLWPKFQKLADSLTQDSDEKY